MIALALAAPAGAARHDLRSARVPLDVVNQKGDTVHVVRQVTITREGIRVEGADGGATVIHGGRHGERVRVDVNIPSEIDSLSGLPGEDHRSGEIVSMFHDVEVPAGRTVGGEVVAIFGNVRVLGAVESDVVAVMGSVTLGDSARVGGDVVAVGGVVRPSPTSSVQGESVSIPCCGPMMWAPWLPVVASLIALVLFLVLGGLVSLLFPERLTRVAATVSRRTFLSLIIGALSFPLLPVVAILLCITVIGIPVAVLLLFLYPLAAFVGYVASCALIGARFRGRSVADPPVWASALLGIGLVGLFFLLAGAFTSVGGGLHVLGFIFLGIGLVIGSVSVMLGLGALLLSRLGEAGRGVPGIAPGTVPVAPAPPAPPLPPSPAPGAVPPVSAD